MATLIIFFIMLSPSTHDEIIYDKSDFVEVNHLYRYNQEKKIFEKQLVQVIWWEFRHGLFTNQKGEPLNQPFSDFVVKDFRIAWSRTSSPQDVLNIVPRYYNGNWVCIFYDKHHKVWRQVSSKWNKTSHTTVDPEMKNRTILAMDRRTGLLKIPDE